MEVSDTVTILKDGGVVDTLASGDLTKHDVINRMIGTTSSHLVRDVDEMVDLHSVNTEVILEVRELSRAGDFENVSFDLRRSEILGLYGLMGAGHEEVGRSIFGLKKPDRGEVVLSGKKVPVGRPSQSQGYGDRLHFRGSGGIPLSPVRDLQKYFVALTFPRFSDLIWTG